MDVHDAKHIRNVALVGHQGSGKTMLAEAMLYCSGALKRMGSVEEGNTVSDYHASEKERQMSVFTSLLHAEWKGYKINILDTPGYPDFVGEMVASLRVADTSIFVMNAAEGVQVGTDLAWRYAEQAQAPSMFVINHLDKSESDFRLLVEQIQDRFGRSATVVQIPGGAGTRSIIDVLLMKQLYYPEGQSTPEVRDIDDAFKDEAERLHNELIENIAENDESLMDLYFEKGTLTEDEMRAGLREAMIKRQLFPMFVTSATLNIGVSRLMGFIDNVCPSPDLMPPAPLTNGDTLPSDASGEPVVFIYRTMAEAHVGDYSFFRVYSGTLTPGMDLVNAQTGASERLGQLYAINGHDRDSVKQMVAGDIGALVKLKNSHSNETLHKKGSDAVIVPIDFPAPRFSERLMAKKEGDEDKIAQGLHQIAAEDPSLVLTQDPHLSQMVLSGQGSLHLAIAQYRLKHRFGAEVVYEKPRIAYLETVRGSARGQYRHKKQSGGAGQFADISMLVEAYDPEQPFDAPDDINVRGEQVIETAWGSKIHFVEAIVGGVIDMRRFSGAIQKGVLEAMQRGPIAGYPVGDVRVVIYDGGMHSVDSNEAAFKTASRMCFRNAFREANPALLEPIYTVEVMVPDTYMGDVMGDLNTRRARIQGMEAAGIFQKIVAQAPETELYHYSTAVRSLTHGRGLHTAAFSHYEAMPRHVQDKVVADAGELEDA
ncbi:MAG: elongation factor G [Rhodothermales bacterium]